VGAAHPPAHPWAGVYGFVNFGHIPWWYFGHFYKKAGENMEKKIISKEII